LFKKIKVDNKSEQLPVPLKSVEGEDWVIVQPQSSPSKKLQAKKIKVGLKKSPTKLGANDGGILLVVGQVRFQSWVGDIKLTSRCD